jgi:uncharacterized membrane protein
MSDVAAPSSSFPRNRAGAGDLTRVVSASRVVYAAAAAYGTLLALLGVLRHESFNSSRFDFGNMVQAVWSTSQGRLLESTAESGEQFVRLGVHVDPLLALMAIPWLAWPNPLLLAVVQALALASGAIPVFWLARKYVDSDWIAARFAFAYLLYPATQWNAVIDFHAVSAAVPLVLFAIWYLDEDRFFWFLPFGVLAGASKEHMPLLIGWLCVWYALRSGHKRRGAIAAAAFAAWFVVNVAVVMPHYAPAGVDQFEARYSQVGGSPGGVAGATFTDPVSLIEEIATRQDAIYLLLLLAPLAGLWALAPLVALAALPELALDLLSGKSDQVSIVNHYSAAIAPFLVAAAVLANARLTPAKSRRWSVIVLASASFFAVFSPLWFLRSYVDDFRSSERAARVAAVDLVPDGASVTATSQLGAHLAERRRLLVFPNRQGADWAIVDRADPTIGDAKQPRAFALAVRALERTGQWKRVFSRSGIAVYQRMSATQP